MILWLDTVYWCNSLITRKIQYTGAVVQSTYKIQYTGAIVQLTYKIQSTGAVV